MGIKKISAVFTVALMISGCQIPNQITVTNPGNTNNGGGTTGSMSCSVTVANSVVQSDVAYPVSMQATGGTAPYSVQGFSGTFASTTSLSLISSNPTSSTQVLTDSFLVSDSQGKSATCSLSVTVQPAGQPPTSSLVSCTLQAVPAFVHVNDPVNFVVSASGNSAPFTFSGFNAGADSAVTSNLTVLTSTQSTAAAKYAAKGLKTATVLVTDHSGNVGSCTQSITVNNTPSVDVAISAATVAANQSITLTASANEFFGTPAYAFTTAETGVNISRSGNVAVVTATDSQTHDFYVSVTANSQTSTNQDFANRTVHLKFTSTMPLNCTLSPDTRNHQVGDTVFFTVTSSNNEPLALTQFTTNGTIVNQPAQNSINVKYNFAGNNQTVSALAVSTVTGNACNAGAVLQTTVNVAGNLSCSVTLNANPAVVNSALLASVTVPTTYAAGAVQIVDIRTLETNSNLFVAGLVNPLTAQLQFGAFGTFNLKVTVQDNAGNQSTCTTREIVTAH